jgi:hypothetical protein
MSRLNWRRGAWILLLALTAFLSVSGIVVAHKGLTAMQTDNCYETSC